MGAAFPALDLDRAANEVWRLLEHGATDRQSPFHTPVLATVDPDGWPQARTVVLRGADAGPGRLWCHSDRRSPKVAHLARHPRAQFVFYDRGRRLQVRATVTVAVLIDEPEAEQAWRNSTLWARRCYLAPHAPSERLGEASGNLPDMLTDREPSEAESQAGRANFCVLLGKVERLEWLHLAHGGHRRGEIVRQAEGRETTAAWSLGWLAP